MSEYFFPCVQIQFSLACSQAFNHRMRSFIILLCLHCTVAVVCLQFIVKKVWIMRFSRSLLITYLYLSTLSLEK